MTQPEPLHPRPQLARPHWLPLDGEWDFRRDPDDAGLAGGWAHGGDDWPERIVVPYAWETAASGVEAHWLPVAWYRRTVTVPPEWPGGRTFLVVGGLHHEATVWVNGTEVAHVAGGHAGLECDVTDALGARTGTVTVRVVNPVDKRFVPHGKQRSLPPDDFDSCQFTPSSGIWQSVWLESRPAAYVTSLALRPNAELTGFTAVVETAGGDGTGELELRLGDEPAVRASLGSGRAEVPLPVREPRLWSPRSPYVYEVRAVLHTVHGDDAVTASAGLRSIEARGRELFLNGERLYLRGVLDQGYWPGTGLTAPDDGTLCRDLELARDAGFTFVRKHLKFEDPRQLYWADRLGMLMWVEPPSIGAYSPESVRAFQELVPAMIERYGNHPSVVVWGLYNEEWGLGWRAAEDAERAGVLRRISDLAHELDPTRLVVDDSGWSHVRTDLLDWHVYTADLATWDAVVSGVADGTMAVLPIGLGPEHDLDRPLWAGRPDERALPVLNTEYGVGHTSVERGWHLRWQTQRLRREDGVCGYIYCELTDIEHEMAGTYTFARARKDLGGTVPSDVHADTVLIPDLLPVRPGADVMATTDAELAFDVYVSHHGAEPFSGTLRWAWQHTHHGAGSVTASAKPYVRSDPYPISTTTPAALPRTGGPARLTLTAEDAGGVVVARTFVDVSLGG